MQHDLTIICDDVRHEVGHKVTIVGIYDEAILLAKFPARIAKLCLFQRWKGSDQPSSFRLEVKGNALGSTFAVEGKRDETNYNPAATRAQLTVAFSPFDVLSAGECEFVTYLGADSSPSHVHRLEFRLDPGLGSKVDS